MIEASRSYQEGKVENLAGYLLSAIKNNYQPPKLKQASLINMQEAKRELELVELKRQVEDIRLDYRAYREKTIHEAIDALPSHEQDQFMAQFMQCVEPFIHTILRLQGSKYTRSNILESPQMKAQLRQFALRELDLLSLLPLEEFVAALDEEKRDVWQKLRAYDPDHPLLRFSE